MIETIKRFFKKKLPLLDIDEDLEIHWNLSTESSPGKVYTKKENNGARQFWFEPRGLFDLKELSKPLSNDTSLGVGYAPYTLLENVVLKIEKTLNDRRLKKTYPWLGSDIKILGFKDSDVVRITMCIPQISSFVKNLQEYRSNFNIARKIVENTIKGLSITKWELNINTRDNYDISELYLTAIGSSIESGDEGVVGRGNRINGLISASKPMSMEGSCGKNPVYHIGKLYYIAAQEIAKKVYAKFHIQNEIYLASQSGRYLLDPWVIAVNVPPSFDRVDDLRAFIAREIERMPKLTKEIIAGKLSLF